MTRARAVAGWSALATAVVGVVAVGFFVAQPLLGYSDTDDPSSGVAFSRDHTVLVTAAGVSFLVLAILVVIMVAATAQTLGGAGSGWPLAAASAAGYVSGGLLLLYGVMRVGSSGPLVHIADLDESWGETAYLVVQLAGVQGALPGGLLALALWATALGILGWRDRSLPRAVCVLAVIPALHVVTRLLGGLVPTTELVWFLGVLTIPATILWCGALGIGLLARGRAAAPA